ncbi:hypothetical protein MLD38_015761 [Melastoma candidum]|uniref:Uncharacterized protein n=1 Tax=Melastoma candidum TaxID=119954 RepID=A0ACB9RLD7_9MYRT|nr:hypothetical protein MLD38_015761 [Melastoma candidum]
MTPSPQRILLRGTGFCLPSGPRLRLLLQHGVVPLYVTTMRLKVDQKLGSIESAVDWLYLLMCIKMSFSSNTTTCIASAGTALVIGYDLGWCVGRWHATRKFRREQMKQLGQTMPRRQQMLSRMKPRGGLKLQFLTKMRSPVPAKPCQDATAEAPGGVACAKYIPGQNM